MIPRLPTSESLFMVAPEICLTIAMCAVILVPFINRKNVSLPTLAALIGTGIALFFAAITLGESKTSAVTGNTLHFGEMLAVDPFSQFFKVILLLFTLLVIVMWMLTSRDKQDPKDVPDFLCLLFGAVIGMSLMASATNLLMIFIAVESASMPSFALAGFRKRTKIGSESSLKYVLFGSAASAIGVYGMSLVYGSAGSLDLSNIAELAASDGISPMFAVGLLAMFAGIAFKLSAVPLHFWCPDVFQGAPIEVTTFLSVASKGAAIVLLVRILMMFGMAGVSDGFPGIMVAVAVMGVITATWGNLAAFHQNNIKRLLAYSSIAHAGYMIMAASVAAIATYGDNGVFSDSLADKTEAAIGGGILFYLAIYTFMNLGAFTVAALIAERTGSEDIRDYAGLSKRSPVLAVLLMVFLLSLFGMPGLGGFQAKILLAGSMGQAGNAAGVALVAGLFINTLISLFYYLRPVYQCYFVNDEEDRPTIVPQMAPLVLLGACALIIVVTGILPNAPMSWSEKAGVMSSIKATESPPTVTVEPDARNNGDETASIEEADANG